jgi:tetratricopeptide (TPR) repeat protein
MPCLLGSRTNVLAGIAAIPICGWQINPEDMVSLNNLGSLLTISGYAHKSLPVLLYAQELLPNSGTVLNNTGQALLSVGNVDKAKTLLLSAVGKDSANSEAYRSSALIAQKQGDKALCAGYLEKVIARGGATTPILTFCNRYHPQPISRLCTGRYAIILNNFIKTTALPNALLYPQYLIVTKVP